MERKLTFTLAALGLALPVVQLKAQDAPPPRRPVPPVMAVLDANHDGVIDATELANASAALKALDKNSDGQLTMEELRPARPQPPGEDGAGAPPPPRRGRGDRAAADTEDHPRPPRDGAAGDERGGRPPGPPVMAALDANHDGVIDATELANASTALKALDKNGDGQLTMEELRPGRPGAPGRAGPRGGKGKRAEQE